MAYLHWFADQHCSNCGRTSDFQLLYAHPLAVKDAAPPHDRLRWSASPDTFRGLLCCNHCHQPLTLTFRLKELTPAQLQRLGRSIPNTQVLHFLNRLQPVVTLNALSPNRHAAAMAVDHQWGILLNDFFEIIDRYPESTINTPSALPPDLATEFEDLRQVAGSTRYTVIACRSLLEKACKKALGSDAEDGKLVKLINQALNRLETVKAIADWAHTIRMLGNEAAHGDQPSPSQAEAQEAVEFTTLFLELLFSYPERVKRLRT